MLPSPSASSPLSLLLARLGRALTLSLVGVAVMARVSGAQVLETETARQLRAGSFEIGTGFEYQRSPTGRESAIPFAIEYGITDRLSLLVEPVPFTSIRPKTGRSATGPGDIEATLSYLVRRESGAMPAFGIGGEVKLPTARDDLIGTRRTDYAGYLMASKHVSSVLDVHAHVGYTVVGKPPGVALNNIVGFGVAGEYTLAPSYLIFGEVLGNTASTPDGESADTGTTTIPEAVGGALSGTIGAGRFVRTGALVSLSVTYDNNRAFLLRPGFTLWFR